MRHGIWSTYVLIAFAWVLWEKHELFLLDKGLEREWTIHGAWPEFKTCEQVKAAAFEVMSNPDKHKGPGVKEFNAVPNNYISLIFKNGGSSTRTLLCLPGTIDPR